MSLPQALDLRRAVIEYLDSRILLACLACTSGDFLWMSTLIHARISPSIRKGELRTPTHHPHLSEAYNLDDDLDVSFFGVRRSRSTHSPHPLYARPCTTITITIDMTPCLASLLHDIDSRFPTCTSFHVNVVPSFPRRPAKASFAGQCGSYGNHK
jgi:hypothetical protein